MKGLLIIVFNGKPLFVKNIFWDDICRLKKEF